MQRIQKVIEVAMMNTSHPSMVFPTCTLSGTQSSTITPATSICLWAHQTGTGTSPKARTSETSTQCRHLTSWPASLPPGRNRALLLPKSKSTQPSLIQSPKNTRMLPNQSLKREWCLEQSAFRRSLKTSTATTKLTRSPLFSPRSSSETDLHRSTDASS